jgi:TRAP-type C4-dicarboxylate transport system permease small subunit
MLKRLVLLEEKISSYMFGVVILLVFAGVISRYVIGEGLFWITEMTQLFFLLLLDFAIAAAATRDTDIRITIVNNILPKKYRLVLEVACRILWLLFCLIMIIYAWSFMYQNITSQTKTPLLGIPYAIFIGGVMLAFSFSLLQLTVRLIEIVRQEKNKEVKI